LCLQCILVWFTPSIILLHSPSLFLKNLTVFIILFPYLGTKYIHHLSPSSPSTFAPLPPTGTHKTCFTFLPFIFEVYNDCSMGFHLGISHVYILYLSQINTLYYSFSITLLPYYSTGYSVLHYTIHIQMYCVLVWFPVYILFLSCLPVGSSNRPTNTTMLSWEGEREHIYKSTHTHTHTHTHTYIKRERCIFDHICIHVYVYLTGVASTYEGKHSEHGLLPLTWWTLVPHIYLQTT
jgi:hypothetical protein